MKKSITALFAGFALTISLSACASDAPSETNLTGSTTSILESVLDAAKAEVGMTDMAPVTADAAPGYLGISASEFEKFVAEATTSYGMLMTSAHEVTLVKVNDGESVADFVAAVVKGYDPTKWICTFPQQAVIVDSGQYVLLIVSNNDAASKIMDAFKTVAGTTGNENVFYNSDESTGDDGDATQAPDDASATSTEGA